MEESKITYAECVEVINEIETIAQIIAPPKYRRCCHSLLEVKAVVICLKNKKKSK